MFIEHNSNKTVRDHILLVVYINVTFLISATDRERIYEAFLTCVAFRDAVIELVKHEEKIKSEV